MEIYEKLAGRAYLKKWMRMLAAFLVLMWACTILSRSIYVARLPFVQVKKLDKKYIEHIVEADGIVTAGGEQALNVASGLRVSRIVVQEGDLVEKGDLLFEIDLDDLSCQIADKQAELTKLQYQLADLQNGQILASQKKEVSILWAQEDLELADRETAMRTERAQDALLSAQDALEEHLRTNMPQISDSAREDAWDRYNDWKDDGYELRDKITAKEREIAGLQEELDALGANASLSGTEGLSEEDPPGQDPPEEDPPGQDPPEEDLPEDPPEEDHLDDPDGYSLLDDKKDQLQAAVKKAEKELAALQDALTAHERDAVQQPDFTEEEAAYDSWQQERESLQDAVHSARCSLEDALYARESTLRQKSRAIADAEAFAPADSTASVYALEISRLQSGIDRMRDLERENGRILAESGGLVSRIQVQTGGRTADTAAMLFTDMDVPCQFRCTITEEQGRYLSLGDTAELELHGARASGGRLEVTVDYLAQSTSGGYDIICRMPEGTGQPGIGGRIRKAVQGELYADVIPVEALYREKEACYIYILDEKAGILGKELYVEKIKVRLLDENDTYAALEPGIVGNDVQIVISCSKELEQGAVVRIGD